MKRASPKKGTKAKTKPDFVFDRENLSKLSNAELSQLLKQETDRGLSLGNQAKALADRALQHYINAGAVLTAIKDKLEHGEFEPWIEKHCDRGIRTAQSHMRLYANRRKIAELIKALPAEQVITEKYALNLLSEYEMEVQRIMAEGKAITPPQGRQVDPELARRLLSRRYVKGLVKVLDALDTYRNEIPAWAFAQIALDRLKNLIEELERDLARPNTEVISEEDRFAAAKPVGDGERMH